MTTELQTEQVYNGREAAGVAVLVVCGVLSLISVLGMIIILGLSALRSRHSTDKTLFVRTHVAIYFFSLLLCDLVQGVGALLNISWIAARRAYIGPTCTTQAAIKQIGNVGTAIFSFVIAAHTFSLLFLRSQWSNRTSYIILFISWAIVAADLLIGNLIIADPTGRGAYYGISGYWCWITPAYPVERYATEYMFMFASAGFSFILYSLVFLRLRGNVSVSGYKIQFHKRPKVKVGRANDGTFIVTDDRRIESHLTTVARQMLWYPIAYTILVLPIAAARFSTFSGASVPFGVTIFTAAVFMLSGFINAILFCTTRNVLPGTWRQRFGLGTTIDSGRGDVGLTSRANTTWHLGSRAGGNGVGGGPMTLSVGVEKDVEIKYDEMDTYQKFKHPFAASPTTGGERNDIYAYHTRRVSFPHPRGEIRTKSTRVEMDGDDEDSELSAVEPKAKSLEWDVPLSLLRTPPAAAVTRSGPGAGLDTAALAAISETYDQRSPQSPSGSAPDAPAVSPSSRRSRASEEGVRWTGYPRPSMQAQQRRDYPPTASEYPYPTAFPDPESGYPSAY